MPITKSAKRALRHDRTKARVNAPLRSKMKRLLNLARKKPSLENIKKATSALDKAAQKKIIHPKKASRLKLRLSKKQTK
jgi:ribosomal protein S20